MAVLVAHGPLRGRSGPTLLWAVAGFGIFTIVFGISRNLILSLISLLLLGASDMISVIIRATLTQLATPDEMRGRVTAVDMIFIGTSNEFGQFESGVTAQWFGTVPAVYPAVLAAERDDLDIEGRVRHPSHLVAPEAGRVDDGLGFERLR